MKKLLYILVIALAFTSCEKDKDEFGSYTEEPINSYNYKYDSTIYVDAGTLPTVGAATNDLVGTTWILDKYVTAFATEYPNDTIAFVTNDTYTINGGSIRTYTLSSIPQSTNYDLSLYYFFPFGGSNYSANVGGMFVDDWTIDAAEFHNIQNTTSTLRAFFTRII